MGVVGAALFLAVRLKPAASIGAASAILNAILGTVFLEKLAGIGGWQAGTLATTVYTILLGAP